MFPYASNVTELERLTEELAVIRGAIAAIRTGSQSYSVGTRSFTKADLASLCEQETLVNSRIGRLSRGGIRIQQIIPL
ncbi:MAG: hypothetical protein JWM95_1384 [Gemmatimonadetes bacterium]|nr:hypothetical protein [Gemmatimonadota bacterium]